VVTYNRCRPKKCLYQIPLAKESMKYCGVYMSCLWICRFRDCPGRGPLLQDGSVAKIADGLYCGGNTPQELICNWKRVLQVLHNNYCNLCLSAHKSIISPKTTTILCWIWTASSLSTYPHPLNTLATYPESSTLSIEIFHWGIQSRVPFPPKVLKLPRSPGCCDSQSSFSGIHKLD